MERKAAWRAAEANMVVIVLLVWVSRRVRLALLMLEEVGADRNCEGEERK